MDNELRKSIEQGTSLSKVPEEERKKREEEKKKRLEELKRIEEKLSGSGKTFP